MSYIPPWESPGEKGLATDFTVETIPDPIKGNDSTMTCLVFPQNQTALAIKVEGDAFPRWILASDSVEGLYLGDGTTDPSGGGPCVYVVTLQENPSIQALAVGNSSGGVQLNGEVLVPIGDITFLGGGVVLPAPSGGVGYRVKVDSEGHLITELVT